MSGFPARGTDEASVYLGQAIPLMSQPNDNSYLPTGTVINRADYLKLSALYPSIYAMQTTYGSVLPTLRWSGIATDGSIYVAVAGMMNTPFWVSLVGTSSYAISYDGLTWYTTLAGNALVMPRIDYWTGITYGNGVFVACCYRSASVDSGLFYSYDGLVWTMSTSPSVTTSIYAISFGVTAEQPLGIFVAYGDTTNYYTSTDGIVWTARTYANLSAAWANCFVNGVFFHIDGSKTATSLQTSTNGIDWVTRTLAYAGSVSNVIWDGRNFVINQGRYATGGDLGYIYRAPLDCVTWTPNVGPSGYGNYTLHLVFASGVYIVFSVAATPAWWSADGYTWTSFSYPNVTAHLTIGKYVLLICDPPGTRKIQPGYSATLALNGPAGYFVKVK